MCCFQTDSRHTFANNPLNASQTFGTSLTALPMFNSAEIQLRKIRFRCYSVLQRDGRPWSPVPRRCTVSPHRMLVSLHQMDGDPNCRCSSSSRGSAGAIWKDVGHGDSKNSACIISVIVILTLSRDGLSIGHTAIVSNLESSWRPPAPDSPLSASPPWWPMSMVNSRVFRNCRSSA